MTAAILAFLYGLAAGFVILRLGRHRRHGRAGSRLLIAVGWVMVGLSFALAASLLASLTWQAMQR